MLEIQDDETERDRLLRELLGHSDAAPPDSIDNPPDNGSDPELAPQTGALAARDATSPTRLTTDQDINQKSFPMPGDRGDAPITQRASVSDGRDGGFAGMDWGTLGAFVLDAAANKGRGLGQLVGAYAQNHAADEREKKAHQDRLDEIAIRAGDPTYKLAQLQLARQREADAQQRLGLTAKEGDRKDARFQHTAGEKENFDSSTNATKRQMAEAVASAGVKGREEEKNALKDVSADTESTISGARTTANTESKNTTPADITPAEQARLELQAAQLEESKRSRGVTEGLRADNKHDADVTTFNKSLGDSAKILARARELQAIFKEHEAKGETDMPGVGVIDSRKPGWLPEGLGGASPEDLKVQSILSELTNAGMHGLGGSAVSPSEAKRLGPQFAAVGTSEPRARAAIDEIARSLEQGVRASSVGREDVAREVLKQYGLDDLLGQVDDAPPSARDALPLMPPAGDTLSVEPGKAGRTRTGIAPPAGMTKEEAAAGKSVHQLRLPSGRTIKASLSDAELQRALAGGATEL